MPTRLDPLGGGLPVSHAAAESAAGISPALRAKAEEAAQKFEGFMIGQMLHQMRRSLRELASEDSPFKNRVNDDMLDLADTLVADQMAGQKAFGIADAILRQLLPATPPPVGGAIDAPRLKSAPDPVALPLQPLPTTPAP